MGTSIDVGATSSENGSGMGAPVGTALGADKRPRPAIARPYQHIADADRGTGGESKADFLGYFSIGLGLTELLAPGLVARVVGIDHEDDQNLAVTRLMGAREITHGLAILSKQQPEKAVWSRVAGDVLDLALLGKALSNPRNARGRTLFATAQVLAVTALDIITAKQLSMQPKTVANATADEGIIRTKQSITIWKPVEEVYAYWRDFENLPRFMRHLIRVEVKADGRSHWVAKAPGGQSVEWDAITIADAPNEKISWRSVEGSDIYNAGTVHFRPAPRGGTEVRVEMEYDPPFGKLGSKVAMLWREEPGQQVKDDLRHFKQVLEVGEIVVSDATKQRGMHPAQPDNLPVQL